MTKIFAKDRWEKRLDQAHDDLQRENDLAFVRRLTQDFYQDEELITEVRKRMESSRVMVEAYGDNLSTHDYVTQTLMFLAEVIRERHVKD
jgi:hypothetical protein